MTLGFKKLAGAGLILASTLALTGCYDDGYGYSGVSVGYGSGGYYGYDDPWYRGYGPYYGWYDGYYYPGQGYWLYDRGGNRHRWSDQQRRYWEGRHEQWRNHGGDRDDDHARNWRDPAPRQEERHGWRNDRDRQDTPPTPPPAERGSWHGNRGGDSARPDGVERPAPGPMGRIFNRRSREN
jgi:hypothetical protein